MLRKANPETPATEPAKSYWYLEHLTMADLNPDKDPYQARLAYGILYKRRFKINYTFQFNPKAKSAVGAELALMRYVQASVAAQGFHVVDAINAYFDLDDHYLKRRAWPMLGMQSSIQAIMRVLEEKRNARRPKPKTTKTRQDPYDYYWTQMGDDE